MADNIVPFFQDIFLIGCLKRIIVMDHIGHAVVVPLIRNDPDMFLEDHDIASLPLADIMYIRSKGDRSGSSPAGNQCSHPVLQSHMPAGPTGYLH